MNQLRDGRIEEVARIQEIEKASSGRFAQIGMVEIAVDAPTSSATLVARIGSRDLVVAVDTENRPIGFAMFSEIGACGYIEQMDVLPSHAGQRIGAALIDEIGRRCAARGLSALLLSTFRDVPWNAPYYRRLGFEGIDDKALSHAMAQIRRDHRARGLDETLRVFMRRPIST
jgi:GNAT superfamily N-acetyltransferase